MFQTRFPLTALILAVIFGLSSCVVVDVGGYVVPGESLEKDGKYYIVFSEDDERALHEMIRVVMIGKGLNVESGFKDKMPAGTDFLVEYGGQWQWDVTWYLLNLSVRVYDPETEFLIASAHSLRTSLARRKSENIVDEVLDELFESIIIQGEENE